MRWLSPKTRTLPARKLQEDIGKEGLYKADVVDMVDMLLSKQAHVQTLIVKLAAYVRFISEVAEPSI